MSFIFHKVHRGACLLGVVLTTAIVLCSQALGQSASANANETTILFLDDQDVLLRSGTLRRAVSFSKFEGNPVIRPDRPWESEAIGWCSQLRNPDTGKFQIWYQAYTQQDGDKRLKSVVCYAESDDGKTWTKPNLGLFEFYGQKETNIVLIGSGGYGDRYCNSVLLDARDPDPSRRFKMIFSDWATGENANDGVGLYVALSPDGIHWTKVAKRILPCFAGAKGKQPPFRGDELYSEESSAKGIRRSWAHPFSMSDAMDLIYDPARQAYVIYGKMWVAGPDGGLGWKHGMGFSQSKDFETWSKPELILTTDDRDAANLEFHTSPVFRYRTMYLSLNQLMDRSAGTIDVEFMSSRDGLGWERLLRGQKVIARGTGPVFDASALATNASPIMIDDEIRFYYGAYRYSMTGGIAKWATRQDIQSSDYISGIGYASTRRDRFVALTPDPAVAVKAKSGATSPPKNTIGCVTLRPIDLAGKVSLSVNADADAGEVRVEILDEDGYRIRGFTKADAMALKSDGLDLEAKWADKGIKDLAPGRYMVRIHLNSADLFAVSLR